MTTAAGPADASSTLSPGLGFAGLSFATNLVLALASAVVAARLYGVEVIGVYALAIAPWQLLASLSTLSEQVALIRRLAVLPPRSRRGTGATFAVLTMSSALTAALAVPVLLLSGVALNGPIGQPGSLGPAVAIVIGYVVFENVSWNLESVLSAYSRGRHLFWCRFTTTASFLTLVVVFRGVTDSVWGLIAANLGSFALGAAARIICVSDLLVLRPGLQAYKQGLAELPDIVRFGLRLVPSQFSIGIAMQAPLWILAGHLSIRDVGAFSRATSMAVRLNEAGYRVNEMLYPDLVRRLHAGDREGFAHALRRTLGLSLLALIGAAAILAGASVSVMDVFGDGFGSAAGALIFLSIVHVCFVASSILAAAYNAHGRPLLNSLVSPVRLVVGLGLTAVLAPRHGMTAAAAGLAAGYGLEVLVRVVLFARMAGVDGILHALLVHLLKIATTFGVVFLAARLVDELVTSSLIALPLSGLAGVAIFAAMLATTDLLEDDDRAAIARRAGLLRRRWRPVA